MSDDKKSVEAATKALGGLMTILSGYLGATIAARLIDEQRKLLVSEGRAWDDDEVRASLEAVMSNSEKIQNS